VQNAAAHLRRATKNKIILKLGELPVAAFTLFFSLAAFVLLPDLSHKNA